METRHSAHEPSPEEARTALDAAQSEESATINRPLPGWYFPLLAGALFLLNASNFVRFARVPIVAFMVVLAVGIGALVGAIGFKHPGYKRIHVSWDAKTVTMMVVAGVFPVAAIALAPLIGSWVWIVSGAGLATLVLTTGVPYQRKHGHG